jgi:hypothetical protein
MNRKIEANQVLITPGKLIRPQLIGVKSAINACRFQNWRDRNTDSDGRAPLRS